MADTIEADEMTIEGTAGEDHGREVLTYAGILFTEANILTITSADKKIARGTETETEIVIETSIAEEIVR